MRVAVLGAGLQGACVALELARRGVEVDLLEQAELAIDRASLRNEGKIHLGFVYANDPTLATATSMLDGALTFAPLLDRWTAGGFARQRHSRPFHYFVANDSLVSRDRLAAHYEAVEALYRDRLQADRSLHYLGARPDRLHAPLPQSELAAVTSPDHVVDGFATEELAVDLPSMAKVVRSALDAEPRITFCGGRTVTGVDRVGSGFQVEGDGPAGAWALRTDQVVNALWGGRLAVDATVGIRPERRWVHRLKYRVLLDLPRALRARPSATFVLGAYGDVVVHDGAPGYLSWYPVCMRGWSHETRPPAEWDAACRGEVPARDAAELAELALREADAWYPGLAGSRPVAVDAGLIFAWGDTDISDATSGLHRRDLTGVLSVDGYHSVNTGKLTTAPRHALAVAAAVLDESGPE